MERDAGAIITEYSKLIGNHISVMSRTDFYYKDGTVTLHIHGKNNTLLLETKVCGVNTNQYLAILEMQLSAFLNGIIAGKMK